MTSTPVGPVAGGIMACFLVLALAVYCYRHHVSRSHHETYIDRYNNEGRLEMSQLDNDDEAESSEDITAGRKHILPVHLVHLRKGMYIKKMIWVKERLNNNVNCITLSKTTA